MGKRGEQPWCRDPLPLGTVRLRNRINHQVRMVKVRMDGPKGRRWINLAHHWWEQHRGPVPAGLRVVHLDGNTLHDDPENYGLMSPGDVVFLWHERHPDRSAENYRKASAATGEANRLRGAIRRLREWLPRQWYPVDHEQRRIFNRPRRMRWQIYAEAGLDAGPGNWRWCRPASLGWPRLNLTHAVILHLLAAHPPGLTRAEVQRLSCDFRTLRDWQPFPLEKRVFYSAIAELKRTGFVLSLPIPGPLRYRLYRIGEQALAARGRQVSLVPVRGAHLPRLEGYARVNFPQPKVRR